MDPLTLSTATFTLKQGTTPVAGTVTYAAVGTTATFTPASGLAPLTTFTATITTGARDLAGNPLLNSFSWSFTTGAAPDTTAPTVISAFPTNAATGVPINQAINATFSEAMDPTTINTANFLVTGPGTTPVTGTVTYDVSSKIATFTPASNLAANTVYAVTMTTGAKDLAGNALASNLCLELYHRCHRGRSGTRRPGIGHDIRGSGGFHGHQHRSDHGQWGSWGKSRDCGDWVSARSSERDDPRGRSCRSPGSTRPDHRV